MSEDAKQSLMAWGAALFLFAGLALSAQFGPLLPDGMSDTLLTLMVASLLWQAVRLSRGRKVAKSD
jgi:hypothetical protein